MTFNSDSPTTVRSGLKASLDLGALPFVCSVFLGALLIFLVQPMFAKMATPLLGGSPSVWNVSLVCFQAALLGGYAYAHMLARLKSIKVQIAIHGVLLATGLVCLPMGITGLFGDPDPSHPALWLIGVFGVSIALPFAVVSATAPLVQNWYAQTARVDAGDPYHLYAASNIGSLIGLAAYPLLMEPFTRVAVQADIWMAGYLGLILLLMTSGIATIRQIAGPAHAAASDEAGAPLTWKERGIWLGLSFIPSSLLVGATTHITTDIAAAPFLWVPPLTLYLLTFVFVFAKKPVIPQSVVLRFQPVVMAMVVFVLPRIVDFGWGLELGITLLGLFWASMTCHGLLAARRPHVSRLTEFYLLMSVGGVLGGAFNALLAPVVFQTVLEYPLILAASLLVLPTSMKVFDRTSRLLLICVLAVLSIAIMFAALDFIPNKLASTALIALPVLVVVMARGRRFIMAAAFMTAFITGHLLDPVSGGQSQRGFFGIVKTMEGDGRRAMMHGTTLHGAQFTDPARALTPLTYYATNTPIGQTFQMFDDAKNVGVVGLGVGSVACYAQPGQNWVFYEIDPIVVRLASDPEKFTFLSECQPEGRIETGDARITLGYESDGYFDLLLLDAFSSDSVPVHLVTREAMQLYLDKLSPEGVFIAHISNRHMDLESVFARLAAAEGVASLVQSHFPAPGTPTIDEAPTHAMLFSRSPEAIDRALAGGKWDRVESDGGRPWTDDYSNIVGAMIDHMRE